MEGLEDRLGLWFRRMSTAPTTSESMATNKASVAYKNKHIIVQAMRDGRLKGTPDHTTTLNLYINYNIE